jgi:hypothetical protein
MNYEWFAFAGLINNPMKIKGYSFKHPFFHISKKKLLSNS